MLSVKGILCNLQFLIFTFFMIALAKTSSVMLNSDDKYAHPCLVPVVRGKSFSLFTVSMMSALRGFFGDVQIKLKRFPSTILHPISMCVFFLYRVVLTLAGCPMSQLKFDLPEDCQMPQIAQPNRTALPSTHFRCQLRGCHLCF